MQFLHLISIIAVVGIVAIIIYGIQGTRRDAALVARKMALGEAAAALQSLADIAKHASTAHLKMKDRHNATIAAGRSYYFGRAAGIVASIPVDRL